MGRQTWFQFQGPSPSLFFLISLVNSTRGISLVILVFSLSFPRILWVRQGQKILGNFEVFLDKNQKTKEKKVCAQPVWVQPTVENLRKDRHGSGGFCGGFLRWIFWSQPTKEKSAKKTAGNPPAEDKKSAGARPPRNPPARPKIRRKTYQQIRLSNLQVHTGFFLIEKDWSRRRLQSMDSGTLFGCLLDMVEAPMLKCTCKPSAAAGGMDKGFEKTTQK